MSGWRTWRLAMHEALYGAGGFYTAAGAPGRHFRTAAHTGRAWADAVGRLAARVDAALGEPADFTVVDVGAGGGELLAGLAATAPPRWQLAGVEVAPRPAGMPARVAWSSSLDVAVTGLVVAVEWLDVVPVDVVELTGSGPVLVEVDDHGDERLGGPPDIADAQWLAVWWPLSGIGDRAEVGLPRDRAWSDAVHRLTAGVALAVDYAAVPARDVAGTLTGYREGRQVRPVPDGSCDLTSHVLLESCAAAADADATVLTTQREALQALGIDARVPSYAGDPASYAAALQRASDAAELLDPAGLGGFTWLLQARGLDPAAAADVLAAVRGSRP